MAEFTVNAERKDSCKNFKCRVKWALWSQATGIVYP